MRELSWNIFTATGDIESYLLYKEHEKIVDSLDEQPVKEEIADD